MSRTDRPRLLVALALVAVCAAAAGAQSASPPPACAPGAPPLAGELRLEFPERRGTRTVVVGRIVGVDPAAAADLRLLLLGEVRLGDRTVDRFELEQLVEPAPGPREVVFVRELPAGHFRWLLELVEPASGRCLRLERSADVPAPAGADAAAAPPPALRLIGPVDRLAVGKARFEAELGAGAPARIAFELDGKRVLTRSRPPWSVELDLGRAPRPHRVAAVALDAAGTELARDELLLNAGPHRFAVRLALAPAAGDGREIEARAVVDLPEDEALAELDFEVDGALRARLRQPPYAARLRLPAAGAASVRAVARLVGGGEAESVRLAGGELGAVFEVDYVELFATVRARGGDPVDDLHPEEVEVREDGRPQRLRRLERLTGSPQDPDAARDPNRRRDPQAPARGVPIHAGVLLDTSISMVDQLAEAERAALRFFEQVLTPRDRAAVITFADEARLAVRFTNDVERLAGGLAGLRAVGNTTLHDSLAFALHYFGGLRGKRALILLSDGEDAGSRMTFDEVLEFAVRSGVAIYTIGLDVPSSPPTASVTLDRLARETGGRSFRIDRASRLDAIYGEIERELRSQYLLGYQSDATGGDGFRRVEVSVRRPGVTVQTVPGYYP